jgi:hypothetical protein
MSESETGPGRPHARRKEQERKIIVFAKLYHLVTIWIIAISLTAVLCTICAYAFGQIFGGK